MKLKNKFLSSFCFLIVLTMTVVRLASMPAFGFFSDSLFVTTSADTGSVDVDIENLNQSGELININSYCEFSFDVKNNGRSWIDYSFELAVEFTDGISIDGKLFIDFGSKPLLGSLEGNDFNRYDFKLHFTSDEEIFLNPISFHDKRIKVTISLRADLKDKNTTWASDKKEILNFITQINTVFPSITEVSGPKVFFVNQTDQIDFSKYAIAVDPLEGDITKNIVISVPDDYAPGKAGVYKVGYEATNSAGLKTVNLHITFVVWDFVKISSGNYHTLALTSHGKVYAWGYNSNGQIGDGTTTNCLTPKLVDGVSDIIDIAAGTNCSFALNENGYAYAWGDNGSGRLGDGTTTTRRTPVRVSQPAGIYFVKIAATFATAGAIDRNGDVYTWGYGSYGATGASTTSDLTTPTKIDVSDAVDIDLGYYNGCAVTKSGQLYTWGDNLYGQCGNGMPMAVRNYAPAPVPYFNKNGIKIKSANAGWYHMTAVTDDGKLYTWGLGTDGRLGNDSTANRNTPQFINMSDKVFQAAAGYYHTGALTADGSVYFFGQNAYGKHGSGNTTSHRTPYKVTTLDNVTDFSLAFDSSLILVNSHTVYGTGYGGRGMFGNGSTSNSTTPVPWVFTPPDPY